MDEGRSIFIQLLHFKHILPFYYVCKFCMFLYSSGLSKHTGLDKVWSCHMLFNQWQSQKANGNLISIDKCIVIVQIQLHIDKKCHIFSICLLYYKQNPMKYF
ncbi:hypothetical protein GDO86_011647 [Hymenochirus boettgeri]|uniref:Uncharacterized protein n=1 Tax=Hymenochirus boettgeri TaxID=247094 RepID=A0A8T2JF43_9PIPI|nr:hypothetical protein GDO86_011647 [Hymenochirus boettgeri]